MIKEKEGKMTMMMEHKYNANDVKQILDFLNDLGTILHMEACLWSKYI